MHLLFGVRQLQWFSVGFLSGSMKCRYSENPCCSAMNATNAISGLVGTALTAASHAKRAKCSESTSALYTCCANRMRLVSCFELILPRFSLWFRRRLRSRPGLLLSFLPFGLDVSARHTQFMEVRKIADLEFSASRLSPPPNP